MTPSGASSSVLRSLEYLRDRSSSLCPSPPRHSRQSLRSFQKGSRWKSSATSSAYRRETGTQWTLSAASMACNIVPVGKRRDGGTRYWCLAHRADATAKYGRPASQCRYAHVPPVQKGERCVLKLDDFAGGVAIWGAVPAIYDTTECAL